MCASNRITQAFLGLALCALVCFSPRAGAQQLTFEGLQDFENIANFYNGGLGSSGSGPGPNLGVTFSSNATAIITADKGGSGDFGGNPSGDTALFFITDTAYTMNVASGFAGTLSLYYSSPFSPGTITLYSGVDATGTALATLDLLTTPDTGDGVHTYSPFVAASISFAGIAHSLDFGSAANLFAYDDITVSAVPEPGFFALLLPLALGGLAWAYRASRSQSPAPGATTA